MPSHSIRMSGLCGSMRRCSTHHQDTTERTTKVSFPWKDPGDQDLPKLPEPNVESMASGRKPEDFTEAGINRLNRYAARLRRHQPTVMARVPSRDQMMRVEGSGMISGSGTA